MVVADAVRFLSLSVLAEMAPRKLAKLLDDGFYKTEDLRRQVCKEKVHYKEPGDGPHLGAADRKARPEQRRISVQ